MFLYNIDQHYSPLMFANMYYSSYLYINFYAHLFCNIIFKIFYFILCRLPLKR